MGQGRWISWLFRIARIFRMGRFFRMMRSFRLGQTGRVFPGSVCWGWMLVVAAAASLSGLAAQGQTTASANDDAISPQDIVTALHQMSDRADVIFVGRVSEVRRVGSGNVAGGVVEIRFEVEQAVRGCSAGSYVLREWAGLWEGDNQRYRAGQRLLMLLHAPNAAGLSSPVDGMDGAIPIVRGNGLPGANSSARVMPSTVDLRWVGTKLLHPVSYASAASAAVHPGSQPADAVAVAEGGRVRSVAADASGSVASVTALASNGMGSGSGSVSAPGQQAPVDVVVGMLASWPKVDHAVR